MKTMSWNCFAKQGPKYTLISNDVSIKGKFIVPI